MSPSVIVYVKESSGYVAEGHEGEGLVMIV